MWIVFVIAVAVVLANAAIKFMRKKRLLERYGDEEVVRRIIEKRVWQGETEHMLIDSLGQPLAIDERVLKTKTKQIWKYHQTRRGAFGTRVTIENGVVVGWDVKN